ncbi:restriction endonuclease subunit S [Sulfurospirillum multivorans]|uniref:Type I restriction-modification system, specificity subunit S n=2 Tax=Sulfurospirillum multivorans TaxID=66821 RepID=A0AA86AL34_SULMK|nr:restriction endonuclease subunit S [Sulfurospirillum multivorans]AHJ12199.1 type I restriction-modification system, specificity subunit S [Sulfurospirillum multivorans DSM 12446]QEH05698.1 type I restriction-modification system, specificity subunit S [Sulfurospirillum multivorans]
MKYRIREQNELKPSGVAWVGDILKDWGLTKIKRFVINLIGGVWGNNEENNENDVICLRVADIDYDKLIFNENNFTVRNISNGELKSRILKKNDLVIEKSGGGEKTPVGRVVLYDLEQKAVCSNFMNKISINNQVMNSKFLVLIFNSLYSQRVVLESIKQTTGIQNLDTDNYLSNYISYPNIDEQQKIVHFLDEKSKIFDDAISKKEQLIAKLELAKQALISEVVTGKLKVVENNSKRHTIKRAPSELKPSGVEWLGVIPNEWKIKKLKYISEIISSNVDKKSYEGQEKVLLCNYVDVYKNDLVTNKIDFMEATANESEIKKFSLQFGDILITKDSESPDDIAIPAYVNENFENVLCGYHLAILRNSKKEVYSKYLFRFFELVGVRNYFETMAKGVTRYGLSLDAFKNIFVPHFDLTEQKQISKYLDEKLIHFDNTIAKTKQSITKLKEAKEALISEAVTGKIEVIEKESKANEYFQRRVLAAYFIDNSKNDIYFGRVKLQKLLYMAEAVNNLDFGSDYRRHAMGPHDSKMIHSIESQLQKSKWFEAQKIKNGNFEKVEYIALENHTEYLKYLDGRYWKQENIEYIFNLMKGMRTLQAEIVATVYSAYIDLSKENRVSTENLLDEILNHWHDNKKKIPQENWLKAIEWMCEKQLIKV